MPSEYPCFVIDLDHTLLHAVYGKNKVQPMRDYDDTAYWERMGRHFLVYVWWRPGAKKFLEWAVENTKVGIWTLGEFSYAKAILREAFPQMWEKFVFVWDHKKSVSDPKFEYPIKPLKLIWDDPVLGKIFTKENTLMIEDTPDMAAENMDNLVLVDPYFGHESNDEFFYVFLRFVQWMGKKGVNWRDIPWKNLMWKGTDNWDYLVDSQSQ